ncbi:Oxo-4-hydroxy-4-carboxy-5-ureidoimidazoline decarboxylase [Plectosphaerella plurivora]|uniref:Oxo-4-hydroxy-4-carboxy-5-ureidoimidazoline decarboxylase n=1 Tax=Plectosphaerella plurivora TaxID=936078 RepID=A0A9P8V371_9PEZI|nr:Oxo-4-hydroxy-4-carboxy-5-ureidoimidazoline decarboxylase [Plectosphaerella plurivora]
MSLPTIQSFSTLPAEAQTNALDLLFEPSPTLHRLVTPAVLSKTFSDYPALIDDVHSVLISLPSGSTDLHAVLGSHPRLGAPKVDSAQSAAEQAKLQGSAEQTAKLAELNAKYEATFPGLRYVVFVNGRGRPEIMANMEERIQRGDLRAEEVEAINAMRDIAKDRASKLPISEP